MTRDAERDFWNEWNERNRVDATSQITADQAEVVHLWLGTRRGLRLIDVGCGSGWMTKQLAAYGSALGTDLADEVIERARDRAPEAQFVAGDIMSVEVGDGYDVVVSFEVLSHVADQAAFCSRLFGLLHPGGELMLSTQNAPVLERFNNIAPPAPGQRRAWVDRRQLRALLVGAGFTVNEMRVLTPRADHGLMRVVAKAGRVLKFESLLERLGFGWTIMVRATRPS